MDNWQNETKIGGMLQHNYENQRNKVMFVFNCKKRLEMSTFVYFANTFALKAVSSTQGIRGSWNPNSKACFISTHLQSRPTPTWFEVGPAQSMHWLHCWEQLAWGPLVSRGLDIAWRQFPSLGGGMEPDSSWERASHKFSQIKANFSFWCTQ